VADQASVPAVDPLIVVSKLAKAFGLRPVLRDINFTVYRGSVVALLGPNGSGKTTLLRMLAALSKPSTGTITIGGWTLPKEAAAVRAQLGVVSHLPLLYDDLTAEENLAFFARLYNLDHAADRVATALERVGLTRRARELVRTFSRGMQQRLAIARATIHDPAVLLLDEPYTGLDPNGADFLDTMIAEWKLTGRTLIMSLHDLQRANTVADQVLILNRSRLVLDSPAIQIDDLVGVFGQLTA
jgi:heme exporter protein A